MAYVQVKYFQLSMCVKLYHMLEIETCWLGDGHASDRFVMGNSLVMGQLLSNQIDIIIYLMVLCAVSDGSCFLMRKFSVY